MPTEALSCPGIIDPLCQLVGGVGGSVASSAASDVLGALSEWVVNGAGFLLGQVGHLLSATTSIDLRARWFQEHYLVMVSLSSVVLLPLLLLAVVQAVYRQSVSALLRLVLVQLPLAALLSVVAVQLVELGLRVTDALSSSVAASAGGDISELLSRVAGELVNEGAAGNAAVPAFVLLLGALLVAAGGFALWLELLVRSSAVYVAVLFLPLALASLAWPPISHWCRRLVDTLVALILSKFVVVAVLSLATGALAAGTGGGFASVLEAGALLLLATFVPFTILRLVPAVEAGAVHQLEGARQRAGAAATAVPRHAAAYALRAARLASFEAGAAGSGTDPALEPAGGALQADSAADQPVDLPGSAGRPGGGRSGSARSGTGRSPGGRPGASPGAAPGAIGEWQSPSAPMEAFEAIARGRGPLSPEEARQAGLPPGWNGDDPGSWTSSGGGGGVAAERAGGPSAGQGIHIIDRDELGPKIRWIPAQSEPVPAPTRAPGGGPLDENSHG